MSEALATVGKVAGVVASVAALIPGGQPIAAIAAAVAVAANVGSAITARKPPTLGFSTDITIGADQPRPYMMGDTYSGGALVHQVGYGAAINNVPNPYLAMVVAYSAGGPIEAIDTYYADFNPVSFGATWGSGYWDQFLGRAYRLGDAPEASAMTGPWGTIPDWGSDAKLSGIAKVLWSLRWDSKTGKFASGAPQLGIRGRGVKTWDPRLDTTYPGGAGAHRWANPKTDRAGFDAARATWAYSYRPGLHGLRYALGTWERDTADADSEYVLTFGWGLPLDGIVVEDFIELENVCEANDWEISGSIYEPGDKWANLKRIVEAGGAEPCWKGGRLGLKINAPRVALDTITFSDLADGEISVPGMLGWEERFNTVIPKFVSPDHKWKLQQCGKISITDYVVEDGEEKRKELPFELVKEPDQAAQLAAYTLFNAREQGPVSLPIKPRLRRYQGGDRLTLQPELAEEIGLIENEVVVLRRSFDPVSMTGTLVVMTETAAKHALALAQTGLAPAAITLPTAEELDAVYGLTTSQISVIIRSAYVKDVTDLLVAEDDAGSGTITVEEHTWDYPDRDDLVRVTGAIAGLDLETLYHVYFDDSSLADETPTYAATEDFFEALNSTTNPFRHYLGSVTTPALGGDPGTGGGGGGGYGTGGPSEGDLP